jgi:hypothetical protein
MAAVGSSNPTLIDIASRMEGDKITSTLVELLNETNEIIDDATFIECNDGSSHKTTIRSGLPSATWRLLNYGVQPSKSTTVQVKDACGMLEAYAEVDKALADLNGNTAAFRLSEDRAFVEAMNQAFVDTLFYGNTATNPERFMGLAPRYNSTTAESGQNIVLGGGAGSDNTSVWLTVWGPNTLHGLYPKGSKAGLNHRDLGEVTLEDAANGKYQGYRTHYKWDVGFSLRDWRYAVRIANIDVSDLTKTGSTGADLLDLLVQAIEKIPNLSMGRPAIYCNRTISSFLRRQMLNKSNVHLAMDEVAGKKVMTFDGIPVRRCEAITNTEATVA